MAALSVITAESPCAKSKAQNEESNITNKTLISVSYTHTLLYDTQYPQQANGIYQILHKGLLHRPTAPTSTWRTSVIPAYLANFR